MDEKPLARTSPWVGLSAMCASRRAVDFPDPEWPVRKENCALAKWKDTSHRAGSERAYSFVTDMNLITRGSQPPKFIFTRDFREHHEPKRETYIWVASVSKRFVASLDAIWMAACMEDESALPVPTMSNAVP